MTLPTDKRSAAIALTGLALLTLPSPVRADKPGMDLIRRAVAKYRSLQTYSDSWTMLQTQGKGRQTSSGDVRIARPNRFYLSSEANGRPVMTLSGNGSTNTLYLALRRQYAQEAAAAALPRELRYADHLGVRLFAGFDLAGDIKDATLAGQSAVNGMPVQVVRVFFRLELPKGARLSEKEQANVARLRANPPDVRYYIGTTDTLIYRIEMTAPGKTPEGKDVTATVRQDFRNVRANQPIPTAAFAFIPPPGAIKVAPQKKG